MKETVTSLPRTSAYHLPTLEISPLSSRRYPTVASFMRASSTKLIPPPESYLLAIHFAGDRVSPEIPSHRVPKLQRTIPASRTSNPHIQLMCDQNIVTVIWES